MIPAAHPNHNSFISNGDDLWPTQVRKMHRLLRPMHSESDSLFAKQSFFDLGRPEVVPILDKGIPAITHPNLTYV